MSFLDKIFEDRQENEFTYKTVNKSGKETDDAEKITKVIAVLKGSTAGKATKLAKEYEDILVLTKSLEQKLAPLKAKGMEFMDGVFDAEDALMTRVLETAKVTLTASKKTTRETVKFDKEKFMGKLLELVPDLKKQIEKFDKECTDIQTSVVQSTLKAELKSEGFSNLVNKVKTYIDNIYNNIKKWLPGYDKKLNGLRKELDKYPDVEPDVVASDINKKEEFKFESVQHYIDRLL
jgi:hypothetical protein